MSRVETFELPISSFQFDHNTHLIFDCSKVGNGICHQGNALTCSAVVLGMSVLGFIMT